MGLHRYGDWMDGSGWIDQADRHQKKTDTYYVYLQQIAHASLGRVSRCRSRFLSWSDNDSLGRVSRCQSKFFLGQTMMTECRTGNLCELRNGTSIRPSSLPSGRWCTYLHGNLRSCALANDRAETRQGIYLSAGANKLKIYRNRTMC